MNLYELVARFDSRKSFYHKAMVTVAKNGTQTLFSYETEVAKIKDGVLTLTKDADYSNTTRRHVKEFARQNDVEDQLKSAYASIR